MKHLLKKLTLLALALAMSLGAWAQGHQRYTSAVNLSVLQVGDTLAEGASITFDIGNPGWDRIMGVTQNRAKMNDALVTGMYGEDFSNIDFTIGAGGVIIDGNRSFTPVTESGDDGDAWVVTRLNINIEGELFDIYISGVLLPVPAPAGIAATRTAEGNWTFLMPGANKMLKVTYFEQPALTWLYGTDTMPAEGLTVTRGFHADAIQNIMLQVSDTFNTALRGSFELDQLSAPSTWALSADNILASDISNFVDNSSLTEEQVLTFPNPDPGTNNVYLIYGFNGTAVKYVLFDGTNVTAASNGLFKGTIYYLIDEGAKIFYTTTTVVPGLTLRYGSSNPAVVSFSNPNNMSTFSLNGTGEADIYAVFDGDTTFQYDSVAFHVTVNDPATLTLAPNGNGTLVAETASTDTWNSSTWSSWASGADATHTVDGVTISAVNASVYNYGGTTNPLRLAAWSSTGNSITFASDGANFTRIEMTLVDGNTIQPSDGWTISGTSAVWEGNTDSLIITNCTLKVSQIVFIRENPAIASTDVDGQYIVIPGAEVKVVATAQDGNYLSEWSNGAAVANRISDTLALTVNETMTLSASFAQNPTLTLASEGNGTVAIEGVIPFDTVFSNALTTQALFNQMTVVDNNSHNNKYGTWTFSTSSVDPSAVYTFHNQPGDDWLITPAFEVEAGTTYTISFDAKRASTNNELFEVKAASANTAAALSAGSVVVGNTNPQRQYSHYTGTFTPTEDGTYYVGIHAISDANKNGIYVKNLNITRAVTIPGVVITAQANTFRVLPGTELTVKATPAAIHYVASWSNDAAVDNRLGAAQTFTMPAENTTLSASFAQNPTITLASNNGGEFEVVLPSYEPKIFTADAPASGTRSNDTIQVTLEGQLEYSSNFGWQAEYVDNSQGSITVTAANGFTIESCKFNFKNGSHTVTEAPFTVYTYCQGSLFTIRDQPNGQGNSLTSGGVVSIEVVYKNSVPSVIAATTPNTYYINYGSDVTVIATPDNVHYLANFDGTDVRNDNDTATKVYTNVTDNFTATAIFAAKPTITLAHNDGGTMTLDGMVEPGVTATIFTVPGSWQGDNGTYLSAADFSGFVSVSEEEARTWQAPASGTYWLFYKFEGETGHRLIFNNGEYYFKNSNSLSHGNYYNQQNNRTIAYTTGAIPGVMPAGVVSANATRDTFVVDYGTTLTVTAQATALHHVQGWLDQNDDTMAVAQYSDYFITTPENLFPAKSSLTLTITGDTTTRALFGINSYDLTAQVAETDDLRGTVSFDYTDVEGNAQAIGDTNAMTVTAQGGSQTTVTATAMTGYHFVKWQNQAGDSVSNLDTLRVTEAGNYTAVFDTNEYKLVVALCDSCEGRGTVTPADTTTVKHFLSYEISVVPNIAYFFTEWSDGDSNAVRTVSLVSDSTIKATLIPKKVLTFAHNEGGQMEFIVPQDVTTFEGIATTSLSQNGITVTAANADADGMYLSNGSSINISIAGTEKSITQVDFHVTNGANLVNTITVVPDATITYTANNDYGSVMGLNAGSLTISSPTTHDLQIDQLTVHYGSTLPNGVAYSPVDSIFYVMPDTTVIVRAVPDEGHYLVNWSDNAQVIDTLSASITMTQDETLTATFAPNPVITLAVSDPAMGSAYFTGFHGNTITRAGIIKAESIDLPYRWYEASEIMSIEGGNGMVTKDQTSHYLTVSGVFDSTVTVITSTGAFNVTCKPTLPNGVSYSAANDNYTVMPYTELSFTATPVDGNHYFVDWYKVLTSGDSTLVSTEAVTTATIDGDMKLQANFLHNPYRLTLAALPDSMGIVTEISGLSYTLTDTLIKEGWEDGMNGWTMNHCDGSTGIYSGYTTHSGNKIFLFNYTTNYPQYLISPELDISDGGTISFWYRATSNGYTERFQVGYSTTTNDPSAFTFGEEVSTNQTNFLYYENTFPAGTKYLCISCNSDDQYFLFLDDLTITNNTFVAGSKAVVLDTTTPNTYLVMADSTVTIVANANMGYHITGWSNNAEVNSLTSDTIQVTMVSDSTISASFGNNPVVTLAANGNGTVAAGPLPAFAVDNQDGTYSVLPGTAFTFDAKPDKHYYMTRWDDIDSMVNSNTAVSRTETIDGDTAFSATFAHKPVLTLAANDTALGTVTIDGFGTVGVDNMFDNLVDVIAASSAWQYGVVSDGQYIYTSSWSTGIEDGYIFHQYDLAGNLIDTFNIDGVALCRDMTYDGQYIYGANGETVYVMDLAAHTLVNTIQFSGVGTVRHISYDPVRDAFWVGNWSSLMLYSRTGSFIQNGSDVAHVTGSAFYQDDEDHIILLCQPDHNAVVYDYNINQNTITQLINITSAVGIEGISGGSFIGYVNGSLYWLGDTQGDPNHISVYALDKGGVYALNDTTFIVDYNKDVTMRAAADTGYEFLNWEGANGENLGTADSLIVTMTMDTLVHAIFDTLHYNLVVNVDSASTGFGTATGSVAEARHFQNYTIEATAEEGYHFVVWSDGDSTASRTVTLTSDSTFTASFDTNVYHLEVVVADTCTGRGTVTGDTIAKHFLSYDISATANPGYHFVGWSDGVTDASRTVTLTSDSTIAAIFEYNPALTIVYNEQSGHVEFIVDNQVANFNNINSTSLTADGLTVTAQSADDMGMSIKDGQTITIVADSGMIINQVAFHLTNGANKANLINATAGMVNATAGNAYGAVTDVHAGSVVISSTSDKSININQLTIQYAPILPAGVVRLESDNAHVYRVDYNTTVSLLAVPADSSHLESWAGDTTSTNNLVAVVNIDSSDATVYANFSGNPILTLAANGNGRVFFEGYSGYTVNRDETVLATNITEFPYTWYEAGVIDNITGGNGMVSKDTTSHFVNVAGAFNGTATVVTTSGSFTVTCIPTVPNGITVMSLDTFSVAPGTEVTINAEAEPEHYLVNWNDLDSAATVRTVTVNYNTDLVANFLHFPYKLTVNVDTVMGSAAPAEGQTYVTLNADGTYTVMADSTVALVATADSGYHFVEWIEADTVYSVSADTTVLANADRAFTAVIDTNVYQLIVLAADTNMGVVAGTDSTAKHFLSYEISATPNPGFRFMSWSDGDTNATRTISLTQDSTLTATFDTIHAELAWSDTAFTGYTMIDFNSYKPTLSNPNNVEVRYGVVEDSITVNETTGIIGATVAYGNIVTKTGTYTIYAVHDLTNEFFYDSVAYTLTVEQGVVVNISKNNDEGGSALFADRDSLPTLTHHYASGTMAFVAHDTTVNVVAEAAEGYHFTAWQEGDLVNGYNDIATTTEYTYTVPNAIAAGLKAVFDTNVYNMNIAVADANDGMGTVTGPATVKHFLSGKFIATAETGYHFTGWKNEADSVVSMNDTLVVEPVSDTTLYATFDTNTYTLTVVVADGQNDWGTVAGSQTVKHFLDYEISATPATCYEFVAWDDNDSTAARTVTLTSDSTITASFAYTVRASHDTLVVCDTLIWNGNTYTVSDDYAVPQTTTAGCDSTANLHLTVKYSTNSTTTVTECESYKWHDITYTMSTLAHFDTVNAVGCDSIANLDLTIHYNTVGQETVVTCDTMYIWNGITYISSTIGTWHGTNVYGCDSTASLHLTLNHVFASTDVQQHCYSYTWIDGNTYTASTNTPTYVFQMANGCDSTVTLDLTISDTINTVETVVACDSFEWHGTVYTSSTNTPTYNSTSATGCDSVITLNLTINNSVEHSFDGATCTYYVWDNSYYDQTGSYSKHYTAANGCDSTATLNLTVSSSLSIAISDTACVNYTWNGVTYNASGAYSQSFQSVDGCDSTVTLTLTINQPTYATVTAIAGGSYTWNGQTYTESGSYTYVTTGSNGCDSTTTLQLTITSAVNGSETVTACDSYTWNGTEYTESGDYTYSHPDTYGNTQVDTLHLTINSSVESAFSASACNFYIWDNSFYGESGTFTKHFTATNGCDSAVTLTLTINQPVEVAISETACGSYTWNNTNYTASGAYTQKFTGSNGCDSTVTLTLTVNQPTTATVVASACDSYEWHGVTYYETPAVAPTYTTTGANGCDSTTTLQLVIAHTGAQVDNVTACDSYTWIDGVTYTASTNTPTYTVTGDQCNVVMTLNLTIKNSVEHSFEATACSQYVWDGTTYAESGNYEKHYTAANGCDSTAKLNLTVNQPVEVAISETACGSYTWNGNTYANTGVYTYKTTGSNGCDSTVTLTLTVNQPVYVTVTASACDSYEWHGVTYYETPAVAPTYTTTGANGCDSTTTLQLTVRHATTGIETVTACDSYEWHGTVYNANNNTATYSTTNVAGCDSTVTLNLTVNSSVESAFSASACNFYIWDNSFYGESGTFTKHFTATNGCDSAVTMTLIINQPVDVAISETACGSYTWNSTRYTASGAYTQKFTGSNGCDSTVTLTLTVNQPTTATVVASACDSYEWHGVTYYETPAVAPTYTTTGANGCDSTTTLQLVIAHTGAQVDNVTACDSYTWIDGVTYTASTNTPTYTVTGDQCNVVVTLNLTIKNSVEHSFEAAACDYYIWDGTYYNENGSYEKHYTAANGCDSTATLTLTINQPVTVNISETACSSYTWNGNTYNASGVYTYTTTGSNSCDSTVNLTLTVNQPVNVTVTASACDSYEWHGVTYYETPAVAPTYTTTGANGCDSVTTLQLTVRHATTGIETVEACDSYTWHGTVYNANNNTATYTTTNAAGCDSTVTLNLTIKESVENNIAESACNFYIWDGIYFTQSGNYAKHYTAANGCDSTVNLALTINRPVTATVSESACVSYTWNGTTYTASGTYNQVLTGSNGCDSTVTMILTIKQPVTATVTVSACESYEWHGTVYNSSTSTPSYTTTGANGCDSVTTLNLTINNATTGIETVEACDSYTWHGTVYTASTNTPTYTGVNAAGCDSIITLHLTVNNSVESSVADEACNYYIWDGSYYTQSGNYTRHYVAANGCDSAVTLTLTINQPVTAAISETACGSYVWNNVTYTASGAYTQTFTGSNGCDSTVTLTLTVNQPTAATVTASACDSYTWHGVTYNETPAVAPTYTTTGANGCDSVTTLNLTIRHATTGIQTVTACDGYTWIDGVTYTASTNTPTYTTTNAQGCDSTVTLNLTINNSVEYSFADAGCNQYIWDGTVYTESGTYTKSYTAANGCDSTATLTLTINLPTSGSETATACESYEWNGQTYTQSGTYTYTTTNVNGCDSTVTLDLTVNYSTYSVVSLQGEGSIEWNGETFTESGVYERTLTNVAGCDSVVTLVLAILPEGVPTPYLYNIMDVMLTINHNDPNTENVRYVWYRWYRDGELVLEGPDKDSYSENGNRLNGCYYLEVATDESMEYWVRSNVVCIGNVGIEAVEGINVTLAPNPVLRGSMVAFADENGNVDFQGSQIQVFDEQGRLVLTQKNTNSFEASFASGVYMVRLTLNDGRSTVKRLIVR